MGKLKLKLFKCEKCGHHLSSSRALSNHLRFHHRKLRRQLKYPLSWFSSSDDEPQPKPKAQPQPQPQPQVQPQPKAEPSLQESEAAWTLMFLSRDSWQRGSRRSRAQNKCGICGRVFRSHEVLREHLAGHAKVGPPFILESSAVAAEAATTKS